MCRRWREERAGGGVRAQGEAKGRAAAYLKGPRRCPERAPDRGCGGAGGVRTPGLCFQLCCPRVLGGGHSAQTEGREGGQLLGRGRNILRSWWRCRAGTLDPAEHSPGLGPDLHSASARPGEAGVRDLASE